MGERGGRWQRDRTPRSVEVYQRRDSGGAKATTTSTRNSTTHTDDGVRVTQYRPSTSDGYPHPLEVDASAIRRLEDTENEEDESETVVRFSPVVVVA
jgi:hypothetical protein